MPKGCSNCGFGFLFELLDDYYPAPNAAFFTCDQQGRIIACGRGSKELTGLSDEKTIGRPVNDVLGLRVRERRRSRVDRAGVGRPPARQARDGPRGGRYPGQPRLPTCSPPTMTTAGCSSSSRPRRPSSRADVPSHVRTPPQPLRPAPRPRPRSPGRSPSRDARRPSSASTSRAASRWSTRASRPSSSRRSTQEALDRAVDIIRERVDSLGVAEPSISRAGRRPDRGRPARPSRTPSAPPSASAPRRSCTSTTGS